MFVRRCSSSSPVEELVRLGVLAAADRNVVGVEVAAAALRPTRISVESARRGASAEALFS